jgi:hypothetical protein
MLGQQIDAREQSVSASSTLQQDDITHLPHLDHLLTLSVGKLRCSAPVNLVACMPWGQRVF